LNSQNILKTHLKNIGINRHISMTNENLPIDFLKKHQELFNLIRGYGYFIWKPYIIKQTLMELDEEEILVYIDSTDYPSSNFFEFVSNHFQNNDYLFLNRNFNHGEWTKRDCFYYMDCDNENFYNQVQLEAGVICMKKTNENLILLDEWYNWMNNYQLLTDSPNISGLPNLPNFKEHRHDQSILTNLVIIKKLKSVFLDSNFIKYNFNQPHRYA